MTQCKETRQISTLSDLYQIYTTQINGGKGMVNILGHIFVPLYKPRYWRARMPNTRNHLMCLSIYDVVRRDKRTLHTPLAKGSDEQPPITRNDVAISTIDARHQ